MKFPSPEFKTVLGNHARSCNSLFDLSQSNVASPASLCGAWPAGIKIGCQLSVLFGTGCAIGKWLVAVGCWEGNKWLNFLVDCSLVAVSSSVWANIPPFLSLSSKKQKHEVKEKWIAESFLRVCLYHFICFKCYFYLTLQFVQLTFCNGKLAL